MTLFSEGENTAKLIALDDVEFVGTQIQMYGDTLSIPDGKTLTMTGGKIYWSTLAPLPLSGSFILDMGSNAHLHDADLFNAILENSILIYSNENNFYGNTVNNGTMEQYNGGWTLDLFDDFLNNGNITGGLTIHAYGDIVNNGTWENYNVTFYSSNDQFFSHTSGNPFSMAYLYEGNNAGKAIALDNVEFVGTQIQMYGDTLSIPDGKTLTMTGGKIYWSTLAPLPLSGSFILDMGSNAHLHDADLFNAILENSILIYSNENNFYGNTINNGTMEQYNGGWTLDLFDDFLNNGNITGGLTIHAYGNLSNNGVWTGGNVFMRGSLAQNISLQNYQWINSTMHFVSDIQTAPYQWFLNGVAIENPPNPNPPIINGETSSTLTWISPLDDNWFGTYFCSTGGGNSRNIIVNEEVGPMEQLDITVFLEGPFNSSDMNTSLNSSAYLPLAQPFGVAPWNYSGTESVSSIPNADVVDWVLIEMRDAPDAASATSATIIEQQAAFISEDGSMVATDGTSSNLQLSNSPIQQLIRCSLAQKSLGNNVCESTNGIRR
jgi:hypothetical protein